MIRCSQLNVAERCGLAPALASQYPETSAAAERGTAIHEEIATALRAGTDPVSPEARAAVAWLRGQVTRAEGPPLRFLVEQPIELSDPETGAAITQGTADVVIFGDDGQIVVVDWKTGRIENVDEPGENLQTLAYGVGAALAHEAKAFATVLVFLGGDSVVAKPSPRVYAEEDWWPIIDRIRAAASRRPEASKGPHCARCWARMHCPSWMLPAHTEPTELAAYVEPGKEITADLALRGLRTVQAMREACDLVEERIRNEVRAGLRIVDEEGLTYGPQTVKGRRSASVKDLEKAGLSQFIKQGAPTERWVWK